MKQWYAVYTKPRNEPLAHEHLQRQSFDVFFPRYLKQRSHARRVETVPAPLFPRYLFAAFDAQDSSWRTVRSTRGVIDVVRNGLDPAPVPASIVEEIKRRSDENGYVMLAHRIALKPGARFRIASGPFTDYEAIFATQRDEDRVVALLSLLGREVVTDVPIGFVAPV